MRIIVATLLLTPFLAHAQSPFTVGTASAVPNEKATGILEVPAGVDAATSIPIVVVNGAKPGKVLALVSGAHGTEYVSIIAIQKLIADLDPAQVTGTVILVPLINIQSLDRKSTRLNSSHTVISYAVFCLKKKKNRNGQWRMMCRSNHT